MAHPPAVRRLLEKFRDRKPMRSTSLIITLFGDTASQHGHTLWLGSLVQALAPLGVNERLVRTSVFRLVKEGWLEADRVGRRSLNWQGFRAIAPGTFAKPGSPGRALQETLEEFDAGDKVMLFDATSSTLGSARRLRKLVHESWQLDATAAAYRSFLDNFRPLQIHDYRRALLHDTPLPEELLPPGWPGAEALTLTGKLYQLLAPASTEYITGRLEGGNGALPPASASFAARFPTIRR